MNNQIITETTKKISLLSKILLVLLDVWKAARWHILAGLVSSILLLLLFAELTEDVFSNEFTNLDNNFELWIHEQANDSWDVFFNIFTTLGSIGGIVILTIITFGFLWYKGKLNSAWVLLLAVGGGVALNQMLKFLFRRPRPQLWAITGHYPNSFSFPSGHSTVSLCYFGVLAWLGWKFFHPFLLKFGWLVLMALITGLVGLSRIYFGVHYPTDVIAGFLSGALWLVVILNSAAAIHQLRSYKEDRPVGQS